MKKLFAAALAVLTFFTVFSFTACSPSAEETADEVLESLKDFKYESVLTDGTYTETNETYSETVLTQSGKKLSSSESSETSKSEVQERYNLSDGGYDRVGKESGDSGTRYSYEFTRGGHSFYYSDKKAVDSFKGVALEEMQAIEQDSPELTNTVNAVIISMAKAAKALSVKGDELKVDLNALLYSVISDLNYAFENTDGNITIGKVFANEKIKNYFDAETYKKITDALASKEFYEEAAEKIYILTGGLVILPEAETLGEADITKSVKDFKKLTENVTKKDFVFKKSEEDVQTSENTTVASEQALTISCSGAEMVFTVKNGAICEQSVAITVSIEMLDKEDTSISYAPDKSNVKTRKKTTVYSLSESVKYSSGKCGLTDISGALAKYEVYELTEEGNPESYIRFNEAPDELYGKLTNADFNFQLKLYVDGYDNVTDAVAEAYSFGQQFTSSYNKSERSLTFSGGKFSEPYKIYLNFEKRADSGGSAQLLDVEFYSTAADRDARRLCGVSGEYSVGVPCTDDKGNYYPVHVYRHERYEFKLYQAKAEISDEKVTGLKIGDFNKYYQSAFNKNENKITVIVETFNDSVTLTYYLGFAADDGINIAAGLYLNKADALAGSDCYEFYFTLRRSPATKTVKVEEYLLKTNNQGGFL